MEIAIDLKNYDSAVIESKNTNKEYPLLIRCIKNSKSGRYKIGDFFAAKKQTFGNDPEKTAIEYMNREYFSTKPVFYASVWMFCEDAEIIGNINEK